MNWDRETTDLPLQRMHRLEALVEKKEEEAREEILPRLASVEAFAALLAEEPRFLTPLELQVVVIARDRLNDEGFSGSEEVRQSLLEEVNNRARWFLDYVGDMP